MFNYATSRETNNFIEIVTTILMCLFKEPLPYSFKLNTCNYERTPKFCLKTKTATKGNNKRVYSSKLVTEGNDSRL